MFRMCNSSEEWVAGMAGQHLSVSESFRESQFKKFLFSTKGGLSAALLALVVVCNAITAKPRKEEAGERRA